MRRDLGFHSYSHLVFSPLLPFRRCCEEAGSSFTGLEPLDDAAEGENEAKAEDEEPVVEDEAEVKLFDWVLEPA